MTCASASCTRSWVSRAPRAHAGRRPWAHFCRRGKYLAQRSLSASASPDLARASSSIDALALAAAAFGWRTAREEALLPIGKAVVKVTVPALIITWVPFAGAKRGGHALEFRLAVRS